MPHDEGLAQMMRDDLGDRTGVEEKRMFGGVCFMLDGHMLCGVHRDGAMYRVGKDRAEAAMAIPGAGPMVMTGRPMGGMIDVGAEAMQDDARRARWLSLALENVASLPPRR